jgi:hypothetical protein
MARMFRKALKAHDADRRKRDEKTQWMKDYGFAIRMRGKK